MSAPTLGWVLASDGSQVVEITGVTESPRAGRVVVLPSAARRSWVSPNGESTILRLDSGVFLLPANEQIERLVELPAESTLSVAWDRSSAGFVLCWAEICQSRAADGAVLDQWETAPGSLALAFSLRAGLVAVAGDSAVWHKEGGVSSLESVPVAAAFRAGTQELWLTDAAGHLKGLDQQGRLTGEGQLVENSLGLVSAVDGQSFFAANAAGAAAVYSINSAQSQLLDLDGTVEGVWPAPGSFSIRLHESAKRPIAIWNGESGVAGWMPAMNVEVRP